tara:strand:+ start:86 stop:328 length:243 start_codon:yes stop_codon:yes gene_type:complete
MADYDNTNSFALFKNEKSQDNQPDYTGNITLEGGKEMRLAAWIRESKSGLKFLSGVMSEPQVKASGAVNNAVVEGEDVPF